MLTEKLNNACASSNDLNEKVISLQALAKAIGTSDHVMQDAEISASEMMKSIGYQDTGNMFLDQEAIPAIVTNSVDDSVDETGRPLEGDVWMRPLPAQTLLRHTYFYLKEVQDRYKKAKAEYTKQQDKYSKMKAKAEHFENRKKRRVEKGLAKVEASRQPQTRERFLARRNQINRHRKGHKKVKKPRAENGLPEAHCHVHVKLRRPLMMPCSNNAT